MPLFAEEGIWVDAGALTRSTNAAMLHTRNNPGFFKGTVVEQAVADELGLEKASRTVSA